MAQESRNRVIPEKNVEVRRRDCISEVLGFGIAATIVAS